MSVLNLFLRGSATLGLAAVLTATASSADLPVKVISGFVSPESVIHDPDTDEYLVSNVGGPPVVVNRGFISRVSPDGEGHHRHIKAPPPETTLAGTARPSSAWRAACNARIANRRQLTRTANCGRKIRRTPKGSQLQVPGVSLGQPDTMRAAPNTSD
jgi:hypothetical protein